MGNQIGLKANTHAKEDMKFCLADCGIDKHGKGDVNIDDLYRIVFQHHAVMMLDFFFTRVIHGTFNIDAVTFSRAIENKVEHLKEVYQGFLKSLDPTVPPPRPAHRGWQEVNVWSPHPSDHGRNWED